MLTSSSYTIGEQKSLLMMMRMRQFSAAQLPAGDEDTLCNLTYVLRYVVSTHFIA
jgi:hypothetical protein